MSLTNTINRVVLWEPCSSPHTHYLFVALAQLYPQIEVITCADAPLPAERRALGWNDPSSPYLTTFVSPDAAIVERVVKTNPERSVHILCSLRRVPLILLATKHIMACSSHVFLLHEPRVLEGPFGILRLVQSWLTESWYRRNLCGILAIGRNGPGWFRLSGYRAERIFPFAYFIPEQNAFILPSAELPLRIGFIGRWISMKGVSDLIAAIAHIPMPTELHLAGRGDDEAALRAQAAAAGVNATFHGVIANSQIGSFLADLDVLVLPSRSMDDGWGVVVSEALMHGIPVVATHQVGASIMLDDPRNGRCVAARSPKNIAVAIIDLASTGAWSPAARTARRARTCLQLTATAGARYLAAIIEHTVSKSPRPLAFYQSEKE